MTTVFDISDIQAGENASVNVAAGPLEIVLTTDLGITTVEVDIPAEAQVVEINTPGPQGIPGINNFYYGNTAPAYTQIGGVPVVWLDTSNL